MTDYTHLIGYMSVYTYLIGYMIYFILLIGNIGVILHIKFDIYDRIQVHNMITFLILTAFMNLNFVQV